MTDIYIYDKAGCQLDYNAISFHTRTDVLLSCAGFETDEKRKAMLLCWQILNYALKDKAIKLEDIVLDHDDKLHIDGDNMHFSYTYSRDLIAIALSEDEAVGIDAEYVDQNKNYDSIAKNSLSPFAYEEYLQSEDKPAFYMSKWAKKSAYLKSVGEGVTADDIKYDENCGAIHFFTDRLGANYVIGLTSKDFQVHIFR